MCKFQGFYYGGIAEVWGCIVCYMFYQLETTVYLYPLFTCIRIIINFSSYFKFRRLELDQVGLMGKNIGYYISDSYLMFSLKIII